MNRQDLMGPWQLISMVATSQEGEQFYPFGETPSGMILYDASGYMSYTAMRAGRPQFDSGDMATSTAAELQAAFEGFDAYCGTFELDLGAQVVTHHVEASKFPNWEGSQQVRHFKIKDNQLLIDTPPMPFRGAQWVLRVVFQRPEGFAA